MTIQLVEIIETLDIEIKKASQELERCSDGSPEHIYYTGVLTGLKKIWDLAFAVID